MCFLGGRSFSYMAMIKVSTTFTISIYAKDSLLRRGKGPKKRKPEKRVDRTFGGEWDLFKADDR